MEEGEVERHFDILMFVLVGVGIVLMRMRMEMRMLMEMRGLLYPFCWYINSRVIFPSLLK